MRLLTECGSCRVMEGGWCDNLLMYSGSSLGFRYGLYLPFDRSSVRSRKFTHLIFVWAVILRPKLSKMVVNSFLALSASLPDVVLRAAKPSSRYKPTSYPKRFSSVFRIKSPTSSQTSAPSKLPMVTSNVVVLFLFVQACWL